MKKSITVFGAMVLAAFSLTSCGGSMESDAKKSAELQCKLQKLTEKMFSGDASVEAESKALGEEAAKFGEEIKGKYTTDEEKQQFAEAVAKELVNSCK